MIKMFSGFFLRNELAILGRTVIIFGKKDVLHILKNVNVPTECFKISLQILEFTTNWQLAVQKFKRNKINQIQRI